MAVDRFRIGRLDIELPDGMQDRAERIARGTAEALANISPGQNIDLDCVDVPPLRFLQGEADSVLARRIAEAINFSAVNQHQTDGAPE